MDIGRSVEIGAVAAIAAILGSMVGLGGGVFLVPILTLFFAIDQKLAIGASAVAVVTNSVVGSSLHLRSRFTNLRLAMLLQAITAGGATAGALFAVYADPRILNIAFGLALLYASISMATRRRVATPSVTEDVSDPNRLGAYFEDPQSGGVVTYLPRRIPVGLGLSSVAGVISGMLGVGGGVVQVPVMHLMMRVPMKAAAGTASFMVGMTSVATALVFYANGKIDPQIVVPAMIGIFAGSQIGSQLTRRLPAQRLSLFFVVILLYLSLSLLLKAAGVTLPGQR